MSSAVETSPAPAARAAPVAAPAAAAPLSLAALTAAAAAASAAGPRASTVAPVAVAPVPVPVAVHRPSISTASSAPSSALSQPSPDGNGADAESTADADAATATATAGAAPAAATAAAATTTTTRTAAANSNAALPPLLSRPGRLPSFDDGSTAATAGAGPGAGAGAGNATFNTTGGLRDRCKTVPGSGSASASPSPGPGSSGSGATASATMPLDVSAALQGRGRLDSFSAAAASGEPLTRESFSMSNSFSGGSGLGGGASASAAAGAGRASPGPGRRVCAFPGCRAFCQPPVGTVGLPAQREPGSTTAGLINGLGLDTPASADGMGSGFGSGFGSPAPSGRAVRSLSISQPGDSSAVAAAANASRVSELETEGGDVPMPLEPLPEGFAVSATNAHSASASVSGNGSDSSAPSSAIGSPLLSHSASMGPRKSLFSYSPSPLATPQTPAHGAGAGGSASGGLGGLNGLGSSGGVGGVALIASPGSGTSASLAGSANNGGLMHYCYRHAFRAEYPEVAPTSPKQWAVVSEILTSEASYQASLELIVGGYVDRIDASAAVGASVITADEARRVFHNVRNIAELSRQLLADLKQLRGLCSERAVLEHVPLVLLHYAPMLSAYRGYLENYDAASALVAQLRESSPRFAALAQINGQLHGLPLESLLIMPVQRLPRYTLLLRELLKQTERADPAFEAMVMAEEAVTRVTTAINHQLLEKERQNKVWELQTRIERDDRYVDLMQPGRYIVREGVLKKRYSNSSFQLSKDAEYYFVLFNDVLLYAAEKGSGKKSSYKVKHVLQLRGMVVAQDTSKGRNDILLTSEPLTLAGGAAGDKDKDKDKQKELVVSCPSPQSREEWFADIEAMVNACCGVASGAGASGGASGSSGSGASASASAGAGAGASGAGAAAAGSKKVELTRQSSKLASLL